MNKIDEIVDRHSLRRKLTFWRGVTLLLIAVSILFHYAKRSSLEKSMQFNKPHIARIKVEGFIFYNQDILDKIEEISHNNNVKGVVLHINSPGGSVVGGESLFHALRGLNDTKPIVVLMEEMAASAAYMIALASDHIVAHRGTLTGSVGVIMQNQEVTDLASKLGIKFESYKSSPLKAAPSPFEKTTPEIRQTIEVTINDIYHTFTDMVKERRSMIAAKDMPYVTSGRVFTGSQALELGVIDQLGTEKMALNWLFEKKNIPSSLKVYDYDWVEDQGSWEKFISKTEHTFAAIYSFINLWLPKHSLISAS